MHFSQHNVFSLAAPFLTIFSQVVRCLKIWSHTTNQQKELDLGPRSTPHFLSKQLCCFN